MPAQDRLQVVRDCYSAFASLDRRVVEERLTDDFTFSSPLDPGLDRAGFFERCWPDARVFKAYEFRRLAEVGDEVFVTYECTRIDGSRFCNTEVFSFAGDRICRQEVYFGWDLD